MPKLKSKPDSEVEVNIRSRVSNVKGKQRKKAERRFVFYTGPEFRFQD